MGTFAGALATDQFSMLLRASIQKTTAERPPPTGGRAVVWRRMALAVDAAKGLPV